MEKSYCQNSNKIIVAQIPDENYERKKSCFSGNIKGIEHDHKDCKAKKYKRKKKSKPLKNIPLLELMMNCLSVLLKIHFFDINFYDSANPFYTTVGQDL